MTRLVFIGWLFAVMLVGLGCSQDVFSSDTQFVCGSSADCAQGYECVETATSDVPICVPASRVGDAGELCNDGNPPQTFYEDSDDDGFGDAKSTMDFCVPEDGYVDNALDCDDGNPAVHPEADEICDGEDNDCDGRPDTPATGDRVCPRLAWSMFPGDLHETQISSDADGNVYVTGNYTGSVEIGEDTFTTQSRGRLLFAVDPGGQVQWVTEIAIEGDGKVLAMESSRGYVALGVTGTGALQIAGDEVPAAASAFVDRSVVALVDTSDGTLVTHETMISDVGRADVLDLAFDAEGDLWAALVGDESIDIGQQATIDRSGESATVVLVEFSTAGQTLTHERNAVWLPEGVSAGYPRLVTRNDLGVLVGDNRDNNVDFANFSIFGTASGTIDLDSTGGRIQDLEVAAIDAVDDGSARYCGSFDSLITLRGQSLAPQGGSDVVIGSVDSSQATGELVVDGSLVVSSEENLGCDDMAVLSDGFDVSAIQTGVGTAFEIDGQAISLPDDAVFRTLVGRDSQRNLEWVRLLRATSGVRLFEISPMGDGGFALVGTVEGTIRVEGESVGAEGATDGFLLAFERP